MASNRKLEVKAIVNVDGGQVDFIRLRIDQSMGAHHHFEVLLDHKTFDPQFFDAPEQKLQWLHSKVVIDLMHGDDEGNAYVFVGVVTNVRMVAEDGLHGGVLLIGKSTTIDLERGEMMQTFSNTNLKLILEEITDGTLNMTKTIKPAWKSDIDFAIQYRETDFQFMARLLHSVQERWYFSGTDLLIGPHPEWPVVPLLYDIELRSLELGSRLIPNKFENYYYQRENHALLKQDSPGQIEGATQWLQQVSSRNDRLNISRKPNVPTNAAVNDMGGLIEATKRSKVAAGAEMLFVSGECKTCEVRIGRLVDISMPSTMGGANVGMYRVYKVIHELDHIHKYKCSFEAVPADLEYLPTPETAIPNIYPIEAEVFDNEDPEGLGRVKVKFPFDKRQCDAWIPVSSLDAGGNGHGLGPGNRGFSFIPEEKDAVLVSFLDSQRLFKPYVTASMFHGANAANLGGGKGNHIKTIRDKSNGQIIMNTDEEGEWGITIKDRRGDIIHIDTSGQNINITAPETITITAKNIVLSAEEDITSSAGKNISESAGDSIVEIAGKDIIQSATKNILETTDNKTEMVKEEYRRKSKKSDVYSKEINMTSAKENMLLQSSKTVLINSNEKTNLF